MDTNYLAVNQDQLILRLLRRQMVSTTMFLHLTNLLLPKKLQSVVNFGHNVSWKSYLLICSTMCKLRGLVVLTLFSESHGFMHFFFFLSVPSVKLTMSLYNIPSYCSVLCQISHISDICIMRS